MTPETKQLIIRALENDRGDNYERAKFHFSRCTPSERNEQYGQSGSTRAQILAQYTAHVDAVDTAIKEVQALP